jgi:parallel beta-helix repeat protein
MKTLKYLSIVLALAALAVTCEGAIKYVAPLNGTPYPGKTSNTGNTPQSPWQLQQAIDSLTYLDQIILLDGVYQADNRDGDPESYGRSYRAMGDDCANLKAQNKWKAVIVATATNDASSDVGQFSTFNYTHPATIENIKFQGNGTNGGSGVRLIGSGLTVRGCWFTNTYRVGVYSDVPAGNGSNVFENNLIEWCGLSDPFTATNGIPNGHIMHGMYLSGQNVIVRNNVIRHCAGSGIQISTDNLYNVDTFKVYGNLIYSNGFKTNQTCVAHAIHSYGNLGGGRKYIYGNTIFGGVDCGQGTTYLTNNIIFGHPFQATPIVGASTRYPGYNTGPAMEGDHNTIVTTNNVGFVDIGKGLYWLKSTSPARSAAKIDCFGNPDWWGVNRGQVLDPGFVQSDAALESDTRNLETTNWPNYWDFPAPVTSGGRLVYASPSNHPTNPGRDSNDGSIPSKPKTLQGAIGAWVNAPDHENDTVVMLDGVYNTSESPQQQFCGFSVGYDGADAYYYAKKIVALNRGQAIITAPGGYTKTALQLGSNGREVVGGIISGVCVSNIPNSSGITLCGSLGVVSNCLTTQIWAKGINVNGNSNVVDSCLIEYSLFNNKAPQPGVNNGYGMYVEGRGNVLRNLVLRHNTGPGMHLYSGNLGVEERDNVVQNCLFYDNGTAGDPRVMGSIEIGYDSPSTGGTNYLIGCVFTNGINMYRGVACITNCIIGTVQTWANYTTLDPIRVGAATVYADYNLVPVPFTRYDHGNSPTYVYGTHNKTNSNLGYVDTTKGLYWLKSDSGARSNALTTACAPVNFFGASQTRVDDIGFVQYDSVYAADSRNLETATPPNFWGPAVPNEPPGGGNYYVSPTGTTGTGHGTAADPGLLQWAINNAGASATIILLDGVYRPTNTDGTLYSGKYCYQTYDNGAVRFVAQNKWGAVLADGGMDGHGLLDIFNKDNALVDGLRITNALFFGIKLTGNTGTVRNCWIQLNKASGLDASAADKMGHVIEFNLFDQNGISDLDHGLYIAGSHHTVRGNVARKNLGYGIHLYSGSGTANTDNRFYNNLTYGHPTKFGFCIYAVGSGDVNYVYGNTMDGMQAMTGTVGLTNNIILTGAEDRSNPISDAGATINGDYNIATNHIAFDNSGTHNKTNTVSEIGFVDTAKGLYWLKSDSAARTNALSSVYGTNDFFGSQQSAIEDIGFVQYRSDLATDSRDFETSDSPDFWARTPPPAVGDWWAIFQDQIGTNVAGATVTLPDGAFELSQTLVITNYIILKGGGTNATFLYGAARPMILVAPVLSQAALPLQITGMTITNTGTGNTIDIVGRNSSGVGPVIDAIRICTNRFYGGASQIFASGYVYGLIDTCYSSQGSNNGAFVKIIGDGDAAWSRAITPGTTNALVVEDCYVKRTGWPAAEAIVTDSARLTVRYCTFTNDAAYTENLGQQIMLGGNTPVQVGTVLVEGYSNLFSAAVSGIYAMVDMQGGSQIWYSNRFVRSGSYNPIEFWDFNAANGRPLVHVITNSYCWGNASNGLPVDFTVEPDVASAIALGRNFQTHKPNNTENFWPYRPLTYPHALRNALEPPATSGTWVFDFKSYGWGSGSNVAVWFNAGSEGTTYPIPGTETYGPNYFITNNSFTMPTITSNGYTLASSGYPGEILVTGPSNAVTTFSFNFAERGEGVGAPVEGWHTVSGLVIDRPPSRLTVDFMRAETNDVPITASSTNSTVTTATFGTFKLVPPN